MAASQGKDGYEYNVYIVDLTSRQVKKLTNHGYATDFVSQSVVTKRCS